MTTPADRLREALEAAIEWAVAGEVPPDTALKSMRAALAASGHSLPPVVEPCAVERSTATAPSDPSAITDDLHDAQRDAAMTQESQRDSVGIETQAIPESVNAAKARLEEARWWEHLVGDEHHEPLASECMYCIRILDLERAVLKVEQVVAANERASQWLPRAASGTVDATVTNLSQQDYENLVRDAMLWRKRQMGVSDCHLVGCGIVGPHSHNVPSPTVPEGDQGDVRAAVQELCSRLATKAFPLTPHDTAEACITLTDLQDEAKTIVESLRQPAAPSGAAASIFPVDWDKFRDMQPDINIGWCQYAEGVIKSKLLAALAQESKTGAVTETK